MANAYLLKKEDIIASIKKFDGKVAVVAQDLKVSTNTIYNYSYKFKAVKTALKNAQDHWDCDLVDTAEVKLKKAVNKGYPWAIRYVLDNKGKSRGYGAIPTNDVSDAIRIKVRINK